MFWRNFWIILSIACSIITVISGEYWLCISAIGSALIAQSIEKELKKEERARLRTLEKAKTILKEISEGKYKEEN